MKTAAQIMKSKAIIRTELEKHLPKQQSDAVWQRAEKKLDDLLKQYADLPKGVHTHTDHSILPAAAIYLTAKEYIPQEQAYAVIENAAIAHTTKIGDSIKKILKLPLMRDLFIKMWDPLTKKVFGKACGFENRFYPKQKGAYSMDILACPYFRYFGELHCPELTKIFCENDERTYGNLPGLRFERTQTLGKGGKCCDFRVRKV